MNRFPLASSTALVAAAALGAAAALLRRVLRHRAVEQAVLAGRKEEAGAGGRPVAAAADADNPGEAPESDEADGLPTRTWVVDNSSDWDGSPMELVVPPGSRPGPDHRRAPDS